jgi:hypothetical protein
MPEFLGTASSADNKAVKCPKYHEVQAMQIPSATGEANRVIAVKACKAVRNGGEPASYLGIQLSIHPRWRKEKVPRKLSQRRLRRSTRTHPHVFFMCMEVLKIQIASNRDSTFDSYLFY